MKTWLALLTLTLSGVVSAQTNPSTSFTLAAPYNNYVPVNGQDGTAITPVWYANYVYDCALTTVVCSGGPQQNVGIVLPNDPVNPGSKFNASCTGTLVLDTRPAYSSTVQQPPGVLESSETCTVNEPWYTATWTGTLTYNYISVRQTHCGSGRGAHCVTAYYPVMIGGSGTLSTTPPPSQPPPPPPPIVSPLQSGTLNGTLISAAAAPGSAVSTVTVDLSVPTATIVTPDGVATTGTVDNSVISPVGDDGTEYAASVQGTVYAADGVTVLYTYDLEATFALDDAGQYVLASGTFNQMYPAP
jgi:hypothetical protein